MSIKETLNLILETRDVLVEDYKSIHHSEPSNEELLAHTKKIVKEGSADEILENVLLEEEIDNVQDLYKLLLLTAASVTGLHD